MRFVSTSPGFMVQIIEERAHPTAYGDLITDREGYHAKFTQDDVTDADLEFVEAEWGRTLQGQQTLIDEVTPVPLLSRVSVFDTDEMALREDWANKAYFDPQGVQHDFKEHVERVLSERAVNHPDFRQVRELPVEAPWPNYLQFGGTLEQLIQTLVYQGHDLSKALRFENQQGRPQVARAIQAEIDRQAQQYAESQQVPA